MKATADKVTASTNKLVQLIQKDSPVGWVYSLGYETAFVLTNDLWKEQAQGIPHNCLLTATALDPDRWSAAREEEKEVILLRVVGPSKLPQDDDLIQMKVDHMQEREGFANFDGYDSITSNELQFGALECRVLGTFYLKGGDLWLGSDIESFYASTHLRVYRPRADALGRIVNHLDPIRRRAAEEEAERLGIKKKRLDGFPIGTVRYTSTDRLHRKGDDGKVPVFIQPADFLARRTAVLGMTRTGKSNMIKQLVSVVKRVADQGEVAIGQLVYDVNGEYANANRQDEGALADVYPEDTVRYRMVETEGFEELQNNFYLQIPEGHAIAVQTILDNKSDSQADVKAFTNASFERPEDDEEFKKWKLSGEGRRWAVRVAAYQALLYKAGFEVPKGHTVSFGANEGVRKAIAGEIDAATLSGKVASGGQYLTLTLSEAVDFFTAAWKANGTGDTNALRSSSGKPWLDEETRAIVNMLAQKNSNGTYINGYKVLSDAKRFHSPRRSREVGDEIYAHLVHGRIVILDLSVGDPRIRARVSEQIARDVFTKSMGHFVRGEEPPNVVIYIEEAHNLIGKTSELVETWPRIAKEGAKYRIALVYATQEVSAMHPNILANTENWFITHLNNRREIRELSQFYDFEDYGPSLLRAQDVGFARVKMLSGPFVVPVQVDKFDPERERARSAGGDEGEGTVEPPDEGSGGDGVELSPPIEEAVPMTLFGYLD